MMSAHSAYFFYFHEQKRKLPGWKQKTRKEIDEFVGSSWRCISYKEKKKYYDMEKEEQEQIQNAIKRDTENKLKIKLNELMIQSIVHDKSIEVLKHQTFFVIFSHIFTHIEDTVCLYIPAEVSIAKFSLQDGVLQVYHGFINPGDIPRGYKGRCVEHSNFTHKIPLDGENLKYTEDEDLANDIKGFMSEEDKLFVMPEFMEQVTGVLETITKRSKVSMSHLKLLPLPSFLFRLASAAGDNIIPSPIFAEDQLNKERFLYSPGFNCIWHEKMTESANCTSAHSCSM